MTVAPPPQPKRVRLCLKDLYHQDVVEMIERETRKYELWSIESADDPRFKQAYDLLWGAFGEAGEMEREDAVREFFTRDQYEPTKDGTFIRYFILLAIDREGNVRGARDGSVLVNPKYDPSLCVTYLSHIYMVPEARGSVLTYWLRIAPVELAVQYLADLQALGKMELPLPNSPGKYYGMRLDMAAEMEYFSPDDRLSLQRILFYGRGGFDVINPRHYPYRQPDFRDPEVIRETGNHPVPFMILVRRMGREKQATLPIQEAAAIMNLLYDDFSCHCAEDFLENNLQIVLDRLEERAKTKNYVELLPLPTGPKDLHRLKKLFRHSVYRRYYKDDPATREYMEDMKKIMAGRPHYLNEELARLAVTLEARGQAYVYGTREKDFTWDGLPLVPPVDLPPGYSETGELPIVDESGMDSSPFVSSMPPPPSTRSTRRSSSHLRVAMPAGATASPPSAGPPSSSIGVVAAPPSSPQPESSGAPRKQTLRTPPPAPPASAPDVPAAPARRTKPSPAAPDRKS